MNNFSLLSEALGWTLLHTLWQVTLVAIVLRFLFYSCPTRLSRLRYGLSVAALLIASVWTLFTFGQQWQKVVSQQAMIQDTLVDTSIVQEAVELPLFSDTDQSLLEVALQKVETYFPLLGFFWMLGVLGFTMWMLRAYWQLHHLRNDHVQLPSTEQLQLLETLKSKLQILQQVELLFSEKVAEPITFGWLRPVILMPVSVVTGLSDLQIEALLLHELAHIRRYDYLVNLFQCCVEILLFFHPAVWWISRKLREEREHCCDDLVLQIQQQPMHYAEALLQIQINHHSLKTKLAMSANGNKGQLTTRIQRLFGHYNNHNPLTKSALIALLLLSGLSLFAFYSPEKEVKIISEPLLNVEDSIPDMINKNIVLTFESDLKKEVHVLADYEVKSNGRIDVEAILEDNDLGIDLEEINNIEVVFMGNEELESIAEEGEQLSGIVSMEAVETLKRIHPVLLEKRSSANTYTTIQSGALEMEDLPVKFDENNKLIGRAFYNVDGASLAEIKDTLEQPEQIKVRKLVRGQSEKIEPLIVIDGERLESDLESEVDPDDILAITVLKGEKAIAKYGQDGAEGVVEITTKSKKKKKKRKDKEEINIVVVEKEGQEQKAKIEVTESDEGEPLYVVDGERQNSLVNLEEMGEAGQISHINVLKGEKAIEKYGKYGENGVVEVTTGKAEKQIYGTVTMTPEEEGRQLYVIDGVIRKEVHSFEDAAKYGDFQRFDVLTGKSAIDKYGEAGKYGVFEIKIGDTVEQKSHSINPSIEGIEIHGEKVSANSPLRNQFKIYPNPADVQVRIVGSVVELTKIKIEVLTLKGKLIETLSNTHMKGIIETTWDTGNVTPGAYLVRITAGKEQFTEKILIER